MTLHDHDPDLIMALAAGGLDDDERIAAERAIGRCPECSTDLAMQQSALASLATLPDVSLTELEAKRLQRALDAALDHARISTPAPVAAPPLRKRNWVPIASIAAIFLALVLVTPALQLVGGGNDDAGPELVAVAEQDTDETASAGADSATTAADTMAFTAEPEAPSDRAEDEGAGQAAVDTTAAAAADTTAAGEALFGPAYPSLDTLRLVAEEAGTDAAAAREGADALPELAFAPIPGDAADCSAAGALFVGGPLSSYTLGSVLVAEIDQRVIVSVHVTPEDDVTLVLHDPETCAVLGPGP